MRQGGSLYSGGPKRKGPLRKIVRHLTYSGNIFQSERVELECGHQANSWGGTRAICVECGRVPT